MCGECGSVCACGMCGECGSVCVWYVWKVWECMYMCVTRVESVGVCMCVACVESVGVCMCVACVESVGVYVYVCSMCGEFGRGCIRAVFIL